MYVPSGGPDAQKLPSRVVTQRRAVQGLLIFWNTGWSREEKTERFETVKQAFLAHPNVLKATASRWPIGSGQGYAREIRTEKGESYQFVSQEVDKDFLDTHGIPLTQGRNFREGDDVSSVILNETALKLFDQDVLADIKMSGVANNTPKTVVGVMRDFHSQSLHEDIPPMMLVYLQRHVDLLTLKIKKENLPETLAFMEQTWSQFVPGKPFEFSLLDERLGQLYREDLRAGQVVGTFALLTILVACLGLFGLAAYTAEQRTKETGVRKVLGANVPNIVRLLSKEFVKLVLIANVIAWPVAYMAADDWLQDFAYRVDLPWWVFALSGLTALLIALGTVGYQAVRAAVSDPIDVLRYE